jgi:oligopeptide transport system ATP-binding protein
LSQRKPVSFANPSEPQDRLLGGCENRRPTMNQVSPAENNEGLQTAQSTSHNGDQPLVEVDNLTKYFPVTRGIIIERQVGAVKAVDGISFDIQRGETLGLVGESGCGKTTAGRTMLGLYPMTDGSVKIDGQEVSNANRDQMLAIRRKAQMIFQDPYASLNPRWTVNAIVSEPLRVHKLINNERERNERVKELLNLVGLSGRLLNRFPHEFSGGQRQRIGVARALASEPAFIICDEPISALDVSIQAQVVNLLEELQDQFSLTYLFIAHDLSMVRHICDRVAVMYLGVIMELADRDELYENPLHPYSQALLSAVPIPDPKKDRARHRIILTGDVPSPLNPPSGCRFHPRCPIAMEICSNVEPEWRELKPNHWVACHAV